MSKRNKIVIESDEANFLKQTRQQQQLSLQDVADLLKVSKQQVHLMESGRANISDNYLRLFKSSIGVAILESKAIEAKAPMVFGASIKQICLAKIEKLSAADMEKLNFYLDQLMFFG